MICDRDRVPVVGMALVIVALFAAVPAHADTSLPANADVRVGSAVNLDTFTRAVATRYHVELRRVVAADIDRDGDVDFVAATDGGLRVWVNDGRGDLTAKTPAQGIAPVVIASGVAWNGDSSRRDLSVQNELPSPRYTLRTRMDRRRRSRPHVLRSRLHSFQAPPAALGIPRAPPR